MLLVAAAAAAPQFRPPSHTNSRLDQNTRFRSSLHRQLNADDRSDFGLGQDSIPSTSFRPSSETLFNRDQRVDQNQNLAGRFGGQQQQQQLKRHPANQEADAILLRQSFDQDLAGNYQYSYELSNGQQVRSRNMPRLVSSLISLISRNMVIPATP